MKHGVHQGTPIATHFELAIALGHPADSKEYYLDRDMQDLLLEQLGVKIILNIQQAIFGTSSERYFRNFLKYKKEENIQHKLICKVLLL